MKYIFFVLLILSKNTIALNTSKWELNIKVPQKVKDLVAIKNKKSIEYQVLAYESAMDVWQLAKLNRKVGNLAKAIHFMNLGITLFPYRDDFVAFYTELIGEFTAETNALISNQKIECSDLNKRIALVSSLSKKYAYKIKNKNINCRESKSSEMINFSSLDLSRWMKYELPKENSQNVSKDTQAEDLYMAAKLAKARAQKDYKKSQRVFKLRFPKAEIILGSIKVLGNFSLFTDLKVKTDYKGNTFMSGPYMLNQGDSTYSIDTYCRNISKFFGLPKNELGTIKYVDVSTCGATKHSYMYESENKFYSNSWFIVNGTDIKVMEEGARYSDDRAKSSKPLFKLFTRFIDMNVVFNYKNGKVIKKPFQFKIEKMESFFNWMYMGNDTYIDPPKIVNNQANIKLKNRRVDIEIKNLELLKGLDNISIQVDHQTIFKRLKRDLELSALKI